MHVSAAAPSADDAADQRLVSAWVLLERGEQLARQGAGPWLWLLAANAIGLARDAVESIHPAAPRSDALQVPDGRTCLDLVQAAAGQLGGIPAGHEPPGLWLALEHLARARDEVGRGNRR
jgi:hypothetical protein